MSTVPDIEELKECVRVLALAMELDPLDDDGSVLIISHVLFDKDTNGDDGKNALLASSQKLISEVELRNLLIAHAATRIAYRNGVHEPNMMKYVTREICEQFDKALFGHIIAPSDTDQTGSQG